MTLIISRCTVGMYVKNGVSVFNVGFYSHKWISDIRINVTRKPIMSVTKYVYQLTAGS
jgi:hypothetical protein